MIRLEDVLKMSWRRFCKTSWRRLEDVWPRQIYWSWPRRLEDVFWIRKAKANIVVLIKTSWRRLKDVFWRQRRKRSSSRQMFPGIALSSDDDELFLWYGGLVKGVQSYFQLGKLSQILAITNFEHVARKIWTCAKIETLLNEVVQ